MLQRRQGAGTAPLLAQIYNESGKAEDLDSLSDAEVLELAGNLKKGVPFATPVFDGATRRNPPHADLAYPDDIAKEGPDGIEAPGHAVRRPHRRSLRASGHLG
jgi:hypothetical protein